MITHQKILTPPSGVTRVELLPEFVRLPRSGDREYYTGLSRSALYQLILGERPAVKSICLRKRGAKRGTRLIVLHSLLAHLSDAREADGSQQGEAQS